MNRYDGVRRVKRILVAGAVLIVVASLWVSHGLISDLKNEEQTKMGVWAEAMRSLTSADETTDLNLVLRVINDNHTIPVIVTDEKGRVTTSRNLRLRYRTSRDSVKQVNEALARLKAGGHSMRISLGTDEVGETHATALYIYYGQSLLLQRLAWFPYVQLGVVTVFLLVALLALLSTKRAEQNKVWVGLTKETAHQLGTPISSKPIPTMHSSTKWRPTSADWRWSPNAFRKSAVRRNYTPRRSDRLWSAWRNTSRAASRNR